MRDLLRYSKLRQSVGALVLCATFLATSAHAQTQSTQESRRAAGEAFDRGTSAMLQSDFRAAAHFFEQAYRLAPAAVALKQAIRAHDRSGNGFRAANLALRLREQYPNDADGQSLANDVIGRYGLQFVEVAASCEECAILVNDALVGEHISGTVRFYIQPGAAATITGSFSTGDVRTETRGEAGTSVELEGFVAPPPPPEPEVVPGQDNPPQASAREEDGGLPLGVFIGAASATAVLGGLTIWSGVDTLNGVNAYEANPTLEAYNSGHDKEVRTNILIGVTSGVGVAAAVIAIFTDWDGDEEEAAPTSRRVQALTATVSPTVGGAAVLLGGRF